jgi:hypothetical protein
MWLIPLVDDESPVHLLDKIERKKKKLKWRWFVLSLIRYQAIAFISTPACLPARVFLRGFSTTCADMEGPRRSRVWSPASLPRSRPHSHRSQISSAPRNLKQLKKIRPSLISARIPNKRLVSSHNASLCPFKSHPSIHKDDKRSTYSSGTMVTMVKPKWWILPFQSLTVTVVVVPD